jgi:hypothetical protein
MVLWQRSNYNLSIADGNQRKNNDCSTNPLGHGGISYNLNPPDSSLWLLVKRLYTEGYDLGDTAFPEAINSYIRNHTVPIRNGVIIVHIEALPPEQQQVALRATES